MDLGIRILKFFEYAYNMGFFAGVSWYEGEFHVTVTGSNGHVYSSGQASNLSDALDECSKGFQNIGA